MARNDPLRNFRFRLEIDSITQAGFSEVAIGETTIDAVDYREGTDPPHVRKLSGLTKYGNITLKWGGRRDSHSSSTSGTRTSSAGQIKDAAQEGRDRRAGRGRRRQGALRRHRGLADEVRPERPQRQGQRGVHRDCSSSSTKASSGRVNRRPDMDRHRIVRVPDRDRVQAAEGLRRRDRHAAPPRRDAAGDGGRRDPAAARSARAAERGLSHGHRPGAGDHAARASCPTIDTGVIEGLFASDLEYLQRPLRGDQRGRRADRASPCRRARTVARRRGCPSWGKHEGLSRESLYEEMAFIAAPFPLVAANADDLEHRERRRWCREISRINRTLDGAGDDPFAGL